MMARVLGVMAAAIRAGLMLKVTRSMSTKTGFCAYVGNGTSRSNKAERRSDDFVAGPMPAAIRERMRASVPRHNQRQT